MLMLIGYSKQKNHIEQHFNTSHVNVNLCIFRSLNVVFKISIHLMLMLILNQEALLLLLVHFNTSHVNVNQKSERKIGRIKKEISIHLMLMLISGG